MAIFMN